MRHRTLSSVEQGEIINRRDLNDFLMLAIEKVGPLPPDTVLIETDTTMVIVAIASVKEPFPRFYSKVVVTSHN